MATFGEKTEGSQTVGEFTDYLVKLDKARKITLFLNGDKNFFGSQMLVNKRHTRTWDAFLTASTEKTGVGSSIRFITTPVTGTKLDGLDDLRDKESYVAITRGSFKPIGYTSLSDRYKQYSTNNIHSTSSILKIRPVEHSRIQVPGKIGQIPIHSIIINVYVNGKDFDAPFRIPLSQKVLRKWDLVLKEIGDHVKGTLGGPKALYTVDGSRVITNSSDLESGGIYVIVGSEPGGFQHYCYGCQTRAKHPKKLPPIKKRRRRRSKKIAEKELSTFDVPQSAGVEAISGDQEAQQDHKDAAPVATSQGDLPLQTTLMQPESSDEKSTFPKESSSTPTFRSPVETTASEKIEKVSSSTSKVAEKTQSAQFNSAEEQWNNESHTLETDKVEYSQVTEKFTDVVEESNPLQATETEEETEHAMEAEHEVKGEAELVTENVMEEEMVEAETEELEESTSKRKASSSERASSSTAGLVSDMQQNSDPDGNQKDSQTFEHSATHEDNPLDTSATNSELAVQSLVAAEAGSDGKLDQGAGYPKQDDTYVQSPEGRDEPLMENKEEEPAGDGNTKESLFDDKAQFKTDTEEEQKDRSERQPTPEAVDANSDASEHTQQISSGVQVHGSSKISTSFSSLEAPLARDPSDLQNTQKSTSATNIQPHR